MLIAQESSAESSALSFLLPLLIMGSLFYVLLIFPQRRRHKKMENMRSSISVGDEVRTIGGIFGRVVDLSDDEYTIDIGGQNMRVIKRAIAEKLGGDQE